MPNRERVFPYGTDQALGQIGSALDFIATEQARTADQNRTMEFSRQEKEKERGFQKDENKKTAERQAKATTALEHIKFVRGLGTPQANKIADAAEAAFLADVDAPLAFKGTENAGIPYAAVDKTLLPHLPKKEYYSNDDIQEAVTQRNDITKAGMARDEKNKDQWIPVYRQMQEDVSRSTGVTAEILANGYPAGVGADGKQTYDTSYSPHAQELLKEYEGLRARIAQEQASGQPPSQELANAIGSMRDPFTTIKASREKSVQDWNTKKITEMDADASRVEARIQSDKNELKKIRDSISKLRSVSPKSSMAPGGHVVFGINAEIKKLEGQAKIIEDRIERYGKYTQDVRGRIKGRKNVLNEIGGGNSTDPLDLKKTLDGGAKK